MAFPFPSGRCALFLAGAGLFFNGPAAGQTRLDPNHPVWPNMAQSVGAALGMIELCGWDADRAHAKVTAVLAPARADPRIRAILDGTIAETQASLARAAAAAPDRARAACTGKARAAYWAVIDELETSLGAANP